MTKRLVDIVASLAALLLLSPLLLGTALAVALESGFPVLFRQTRIGLQSRPFGMFKFRSMVKNAASIGPYFTSANDPRITRVGRFLRATSLDELPQLFNVLRGEMSLVGPRPPLPSEVALYDGYAPRRMLVKPGLTGLWQVSGRSDLSWDEGLRKDLYYVENWSVLEDLLILLRTVKAVFAHEGAY